MSTTDLSTPKISISQLLQLRRLPLLRRRARWWMGSVLLTADLLSLTISFALAIWLRLTILEDLIARFTHQIPQVRETDILAHYQNFIPALFLFVVLFYLSGLYPGNGLSPVKEMQRLVVNTSFVFLGLAATSFLAKTTDEYSRFIYSLSWVFSILLLPLMRFIFRTVANDQFFWGEPIAVVGAKESVRQLANHLLQNPGVGLKPTLLAYQDDDGEQEYANIPVIHKDWLYGLCAENQIECVAVCAEQEHLAEDYQSFFKRVILVKPDSHSQLIWVSVQDLYGVVGYEIHVNLNNLGPRFVKRLLDLIGAFFGLLFLSPVIAFLVILILLDSKGSAFFQQIRVGKDGRRFKFYKLRTMYQNADQLLEEHLTRDARLKQEWDLYQKLHEDPRVTRVGKILRRFSLDEMPQLFNVLLGDMSLVGPRPFFPQQESYYGERLCYYKRVRPGLTGIWQISGRNEKTFNERTYFDEYYVRNWSVWLDIYVLARTIPTVLLNRGDY